jgi:5-methylcytosine-specific restriction enzyme subunit McrC
VASAIPIRNIYYLLCYAWNRLAEKEFCNVATAGVTELADLLARVLITGVHRLSRRGLERGYQEHHDEIVTIRGTADLIETYTRFLERHGRASCRFDELSTDTPQNRIVKAAIRTLAAVKNIDHAHRSQLRHLARRLTDVADVPLSRDVFRSARLHANNRHYGFLVGVAGLIFRSAVPDEKAGGYKFRDFSRDRQEMARLFESFIFTFVRVERPELAVSRDVLEWDASSNDDPELTYLPSMRTDISVRAPERTLIIDAKYYEETLQQYYDRKSIHSANLYQLVAYLKNLEQGEGADRVAEGMLVYPVTSQPIDLTYQIQGHKLRVYTLDLGRDDWPTIEKDMKALVF